MTAVSIDNPTVMDARAERLLRMGLSHAALLRAVAPAQARKPLAELDRGELLDMVTLLAACIDIEKTTSELVAWWLNPWATAEPMETR